MTIVLRRAVFLLCLLCLLGASAALAQCPAGEGRTSLEIPGVGTATFDDFRTDRATGSAVISGDVCVDDLAGDWQLRAARVNVVGVGEEPLGGETRLVAEQAVFRISGWRLSASVAHATTAAVTLAEVQIAGPDVQGTALSLRYDLPTETAALRLLELRGTTFRARAVSGTISGDRLTLVDAVATTCMCEGAEVYSVAAPRAELTIGTGAFVIERGALRVLGITVPLADRVELGDDLVSALRIPFRVQNQALSRGDLGEGATVTFPLVVEAAAPATVTAEVALTSLPGNPRPVGGLQVKAPGVDVRFGVPLDGIDFEAVVTRDLGAGFGVGMAFRNRATPRHHYLHEGVLSGTYAVALPLPTDVGTLGLSSRAFAAVSAQRISGEVVAGPRLGAELRLAYASPETPVGRFRVDAATRGTLYPNQVYPDQLYPNQSYPDQSGHQIVFSVASSWAFSGAGLRLGVAHSQRVVLGGSPVAETLDRVGAQRLLTVTAEATSGPETARFSATFLTRYDFLPAAPAGPGPGLTELRGDFSGVFAVGTGTLAVSTAFDLAGAVSDRAQQAHFIESDASYAWSAGHELGTRVRWDLGTGTPSDAELFGRVRFTTEHVDLTPFLAVDFAGLFADGGPELSGHGLELEWRSCCGTIVVGYEQRGESFGTTLAFRVDPRPLPPITELP